MRRYKWAFKPEYGDIKTPATLQPSWEHFLEARLERSNVSLPAAAGETPGFTPFVKNESYSPSDSVRLARDILIQLIESPLQWAGPWAGEVAKVSRSFFFRRGLMLMPFIQASPHFVRCMRRTVHTSCNHGGRVKV